MKCALRNYYDEQMGNYNTAIRPLASENYRFPFAGAIAAFGRLYCKYKS